MEEEVASALNASALNIYDLLVRLVPGAVVLSPLLLFFKPCGVLASLKEQGALVFFCYVAMSYAAGILLRGLARVLMTRVHSLIYGGEPRDRFLQLSAKKTKEVLKGKTIEEADDEDRKNLYDSVRRSDDAAAVLKYADERRLALQCTRKIDGILQVGEASPRLCFGYMVSFLEVHGAAGKEDRVNCLADMCASLAPVIVIFGIECILLLWMEHPKYVWIVVALLLVLIVVLPFFCVNIAIHYEQMRFSTVVRTYAIMCGKTRAADVVQPRVHQNRGSIKLLKDN